MPTTTPFNNLITFSRGSNATLTGPNGLIQWAPNNLLTFSEQFDNANWPKEATTATANIAVAPDGTGTADRISETAITSTHAVTQTVATLTATQHVFSVYLKKGTEATAPDWVQVTFGGVSTGYANFNLSTGTVGVTSGATAAISSVGSGWYRCSVIVTVASAGAASVQIVFINNTDSATRRPSYAGATTSDMFLWGAQLELGSTATTYNPTTVKNLLGFSEAFDNAPWSANGTSLVRGAAANPVNGLFTAQKLMETTAAGVHNCGQNVTTAAVPYTFSCYIKAAERTFAMLYHTQTNAAVSINLTTGATGTPTGIASPTSSSVVALGNGWYRLSMTVTATAASNFFGIYPLTSLTGSVSYTGDGNSGVYIYGAQLSDSASLDPYVPTPGAAPSSTAFYGPRFDFDPVTLQPRGLLVEEQRTNLLLRSDDFGNASWFKSSSTVATDITTSPDGAANADKLIASVVTAGHYVVQTVTLVASTNYTVSVYAKAAEYGWAIIYVGTVGVGQYVNLSTGAVGSTFIGAPTSTTVTNIGNGWRRINMVFNSGVNTSGDIRVYATTADGTSSYLGDGTSGIFIYGAQLEAGAFATSYIPTVASTVTRSADVATITGQNFAQWYGPQEGTFVADFDVVSTAAASKAFFATNDGTSNNTNYGYVFNTGVAFAEVRSGGATQAAFNLGAATPNTTFKAAIACRTNDFAATSNGGAVITDLSGAVALNQSELNIGHSRNYGGLYLNGHIRNIRFIPARAADFQLQALTELPLVPTLDLDFLNNLYEA